MIFNHKNYININTVKKSYPYLHFFKDTPWIYNNEYKLCARKIDVDHNLKTYKNIYLPFNCYRISKTFKGIVCITLTNEF